jgi:hypothetical protein
MEKLTFLYPSPNLRGDSRQVVDKQGRRLPSLHFQVENSRSDQSQSASEHGDFSIVWRHEEVLDIGSGPTNQK